MTGSTISVDRLWDGIDWEREVYHLPTYSLVDAARYLHIPLPTLRTWVKGRSYPTQTGQKEFAPLIQRPTSPSSQLSFTNLVEAHVLRVIRTHHQIPLDKVRLALDYVGEQFQTEHPLVLKQFSTDGVDLFVEQVDLINASRSGQLAMKQVLHHLLTRIEWNEKDIAARLFPFIETHEENSATKRVLTIDPNISFGKPTITGTGIPTRIVTELYDAGDSIEEIAEDYNCTPFQIERAIVFESGVRAA